MKSVSPAVTIAPPGSTVVILWTGAMVGVEAGSWFDITKDGRWGLAQRYKMNDQRIAVAVNLIPTTPRQVHLANGTPIGFVGNDDRAVIDIGNVFDECKIKGFEVVKGLARECQDDALMEPILCEVTVPKATARKCFGWGRNPQVHDRTLVSARHSSNAPQIFRDHHRQALSSYPQHAFTYYPNGEHVKTEKVIVNSTGNSRLLWQSVLRKGTSIPAISHRIDESRRNYTLENRFEGRAANWKGWLLKNRRKQSSSGPSWTTGLWSYSGQFSYEPNATLCDGGRLVVYSTADGEVQVAKSGRKQGRPSLSWGTPRITNDDLMDGTPTGTLANGIRPECFVAR